MYIIKNLQMYFRDLCLVDKCLLLFMFILMFQSVQSLIFNETVLSNSQDIDVVIRTLAASIFGYFISANFQHEEQARKNENDRHVSNDKETPQVKGASDGSLSFHEIVSNGDLDHNKYEVNNLTNSCYQREKRIKQQIAIVTIIGVFSLIILAVVRNLGYMPEAATATLSQLRDFASSSIGFLIGYSKKQK